MIDFQSHGESIGDGITFGYLEALDAEAPSHSLKINYLITISESLVFL